MALNADTLLDRLYLKSQISRWRALAIVFAVLALIVLVDRSAAHSSIEKPFIARLTFDGFIEDNQEIYKLIDEMADNPKAKAVIVWLDTPGGSAVGGEELYNHLRQLSAKKPVVAVMRSVAASAGYMIALGSDYVIAREGTITGSIGVLIETAEITGLTDKLGIKPIIVKSAPLKGSPNPLEKATPESIRVIEEVIHDFYNRFVDMVAERRGLPREKVLLLADGRVYSGRKALENKLIDALGGEEEAVQWLTTKRNISNDLEIKDVEPEKEYGFFERIAESVSGRFFQSNRVTLDGLRAIWHPAL